MLRITQSSNAAAAKGYYSSKSEAGYYFGAGQEQVGAWGGVAAQALGLVGEVDRHSFERLCDNRHPESGERLTARQRKNRRVGYDFNFHPPKSASLLFALTGDPAILAAFRSAMQDTMREVEAGIHVRVRKRGQFGERVAGNGVWASFYHFTARPVGGIIDPHLHAHAYLFNACFDPVERIWKAIDVADVKRQGEAYQKAFHARFAWKLMELGYPIERKGTGWEVAGIDRSTVEKFSGRTRQIEDYARKHGIDDPPEKDRLGARLRSRKQNDVGMDALRKEWRERLSGREWEAFSLAMMRRGVIDPAPYPPALSPGRDAWNRERLASVRRRERASALPPIPPPTPTFQRDVHVR